MKYAVIRLKGKQYKVEEGEQILVDKLSGEKPVPEVLLLKTDKDVKIGSPVVEKAKVELKMIAEEEKGEKITVKKYKPKSKYRRSYGFRAKYSRLEVTKIS